MNDNIIKELNEILFKSQSPIDLYMKNGMIIYLEPGDSGFEVWREGSEEKFYTSVDSFLDDYYIDGKPFRQLLCDIESLA